MCFTRVLAVIRVVTPDVRAGGLTRDRPAVGALDEAAGNDGENLLPYLVECCHAYATVGEMVAVLKARWGEFQEPVKF